MSVGRLSEYILLAVYGFFGVTGVILLTGSPYEWMIGDKANSDGPRNICELPADGDSMQDVGIVFALAMLAIGLGLGAFYKKRFGDYRFFFLSGLLALFSLYRLYLRQALCL